MKGQFPIQQVCKTLGVNRSAYYDFAKGKTCQAPDASLMKEVYEVFMDNRRRCGSRRVHAELRTKGKIIGRHQVRKLLKQQGLQAIQPKSFVPKTTNSRHTLGYAPNWLKMMGSPVAPNQAYVGDITYLPSVNGTWLYLSTWMDLFTREILGWKIDERMEESLAVDSLCRALNKNDCGRPLIIHSDRGGQYAGKAFKSIAGKYCQSMSDADNPYDNAFAESFFSRFKAELLQGGCFENMEDAKTEIFDYIEGYYNTRRLHSSLGYKSPVQYRREYEMQASRSVSHKKNVEMMAPSEAELPTFQHIANNSSKNEKD